MSNQKFQNPSLKDRHAVPLQEKFVAFGADVASERVRERRLSLSRAATLSFPSTARWQSTAQ